MCFPLWKWYKITEKTLLFYGLDMHALCQNDTGKVPARRSSSLSVTTPPWL
jgi:hypothetical protein